jgi:NAD(P)-dependent dehydrogenase (short-subunit alcohol dehydrogenase family)
MELKDKVIIITGGCKGFGKSLAKAFVSEGSVAVISSNDLNELVKAAEELGVDYSPADVTKPEEIEKLAAFVVEKYGKIDIWINNAGIQIAPSLVEDIKVEKLHNLFEINFFGYFYGCQIALRQMKKQGYGVIININSTAGLEGKPEISAYCASKFAIKGLTESIRKEVKDTEIKIYSIHPGGMQTDIYKEKYPADLQEYMLVDDVVKKVIGNLKSDSPIEDLIIKRPIVK